MVTLPSILTTIATSFNCFNSQSNQGFKWKFLCNWGPELLISSFTATACLSNHIHHKHAYHTDTVLSLSICAHQNRFEYMYLTSKDTAYSRCDRSIIMITCYNQISSALQRTSVSFFLSFLQAVSGGVSLMLTIKSVLLQQ